jgi:hypothetical protein
MLSSWQLANQSQYNSVIFIFIEMIAIWVYGEKLQNKQNNDKYNVQWAYSTNYEVRNTKNI